MSEKTSPDRGASRFRIARRRFLALAAGAIGASWRRPGEPFGVAAQEIAPTVTVPQIVPSSQGQNQEQFQEQQIVPIAVGTVPASPGAGTLYFAETGHNLAEPFGSRWQQAGGEAVFGAPLSEERYASGAGGVLQSFAKLVLLYDPVQTAPFDVRGQPLGKAVWAEMIAADAAQTVTGCMGASCQFFPETGHTLGEPFAAFWNERGGMALFGPPVSEPFDDPDAPGTKVQVFESAVMESRSGTVSLRPVGRDLAERDGLLGDPAFLPAPPTGGSTFLVKASDGLRLRAAPDLEASMVAVLPDNTEFIAAAGSSGEWAPGYADGLSGWVSATYLSERAPLPQLQVADWDPLVWQGATLEETNVRREPTTKARIVETLDYAAPVTVSAWLKGEEVHEGADMWAQIGNDRFVYSRNVGRNAPVLPTVPPVDAPTWGKWIDINLIQQLLTAYDGSSPVRTIEITTGMAGWETPPGFYAILHRVANETMTSGAIGAENHYRLDDVLFTQYFTDRGHALHFAWWRTKETIGRPGSHGCVNLLLDDARFFWDWAELGTPVYVHD
ncbi:MAG: L,D-transpeptidase family protein [Chloroflexia bacterium]|nr:L,D-transpeptidase family protein [Chloroflexia bacterium]